MEEVKFPYLSYPKILTFTVLLNTVVILYILRFGVYGTSRWEIPSWVYRHLRRIDKR